MTYDIGELGEIIFGEEELSWEFAGQFFFDVVGLLPVVGALKNVDEAALLAKQAPDLYNKSVTNAVTECFENGKALKKEEEIVESVQKNLTVSIEELAKKTGKPTFQIRLEALGILDEAEIARAERLIRAGADEETIIEKVFKNKEKASLYIQKKMLKNLEEFKYLTDSQKQCIQNAISNGLVDISKWTGKISNELNGMTNEEWRAIDKYLSSGKNVERIQEIDIPTSDFLVDGVAIEFKGMKTSVPNNFRANVIDYAIEAYKKGNEGKNADCLVIDAISNNLDSNTITFEFVNNLAKEIKTLYPNNTIEIWTVWGDIIL